MVEIQEEIETSIQEIKNQALKIKEELNFEEVKSAFLQAKTELSAEKEKPPAQWNVAIFTKYSDMFNGFLESFRKCRTEQLEPLKEKTEQISRKVFEERENIPKETREEIYRKLGILTENIGSIIHSFRVFVEFKLTYYSDGLKRIVGEVNSLSAGTIKREDVISFITNGVLRLYDIYVKPLDDKSQNLLVSIDEESFFQKISEL